MECVSSLTDHFFHCWDLKQIATDMLFQGRLVLNISWLTINCWVSVGQYFRMMCLVGVGHIDGWRALCCRYGVSLQRVYGVCVLLSVQG